jgi:mRNA-degrading endonuclease RelE of RelBE toxin-antitoxin system
VALQIRILSTPQKYFETLDKPTKKRIQEKLDAIAASPYAPRLSKPLTGSKMRTARVGDYRIIFEIDEPLLIVNHIGPRGQIYKRMR